MLDGPTLFEYRDFSNQNMATGTNNDSIFAMGIELERYLSRYIKEVHEWGMDIRPD